MFVHVGIEIHTACCLLRTANAQAHDMSDRQRDSDTDSERERERERERGTEGAVDLDVLC